MKIQRNNTDARNCLNFSQVASMPAANNERFEPLFANCEDKNVGEVLTSLQKGRHLIEGYAAEKRTNRNIHAALGATGLAGGILAAWAGHPILAAAPALVGLGLAARGANLHQQMRKQEGKAEEHDLALKAVEHAAEDLANSLVTEGPGPDQVTDRRYYTGGVFHSVATIHARESGALLGTQVQLSGTVPYTVTENHSTGRVSVRSPKGEQSFAGNVSIGSKDIKIASTTDLDPYSHGVRQSIQSDGKSELVLFEGAYEHTRLCSEQAKGTVTGEATVYCWENGQQATIRGIFLMVANTPVPFQALDSNGVRVLPDGLICSAKGSATFRADEVEAPATHGIGSWSWKSPYQQNLRLLEVDFGDDTFHASNDRKLKTTQVTARDGSVLQAQGDLVEVSQGFRLQTQQPGGMLEQSLLAGEVLLTLNLGARSLIIQHKSGQDPLAFQRGQDGMLDDLSNLPVRLDAGGSYWVQDGSEEKEVKPILPLPFLEKQP
ncbi:MAG: hypothetical protein U0931_14265 [Vulcanimicrobiota bacterium]